jgi:hypothetical protein
MLSTNVENNRTAGRRHALLGTHVGIEATQAIR